MRSRRNIAWLLMAVSIIMLVAAVFPHHHHSEAMCLLHDNTECDSPCNNPVDEACHHKCHLLCHHTQPGECDEACITNFQFAEQHADEGAPTCFHPVTLLYSSAVLLQSALTDSGTQRLHFVYIESLHSLAATRSVGLRAPPFYSCI